MEDIINMTHEEILSKYGHLCAKCADNKTCEKCLMRIVTGYCKEADEPMRRNEDGE